MFLTLSCQPLVAAAMHACILSDRHAEALAIFDELLCGELATSASEWQWGGGEDRLHPACRDLAMRGDQLDFHDTRMEQTKLEIESLRLQIREQKKRLDEFGHGE